MIFAKSIRGEVMKRVEAKITEAQKTYETRCTDIDTNAKHQKELAFTESVDSILSKLL